MANISKIKLLDGNVYDIKDPSKLGAKTANGYVGMTKPDGTDTDWIRTTTNGIIPYQSGNATEGHQSLGTSRWYFKQAYIQTMYNTENKIGNCTMNYSSNDQCLNFNFT